MLNPVQRKMVEALRDYCINTLEGRCPDEGTNVLSALVNTVDSASERSLELPRSQHQRERVLTQFIVAHDNNNSYNV